MHAEPKTVHTIREDNTWQMIRTPCRKIGHDRQLEVISRDVVGD